MNNNFMCANTMVKKITYNNEMDLHLAIENSMVLENTVFKLVQVLPIDEWSAYLVLTPDLEKMVVVFCDLSEPDEDEEEDDALFDFPNGNMAIMSLAEIELLKKLETAHIGDDSYEIHGMDMCFDTQAWRYMTVYVKKEA